jgi:hypothetical protein
MDLDMLPGPPLARTIMDRASAGVIGYAGSLIGITPPDSARR